MKRFAVTQSHEADCLVAAETRIGEIYHVAGDIASAAMRTPIARYFVWRPEFVEGFHAHWRVDCFIRHHKLAPKPKAVGEALVGALIQQGLCTEPIWLSCYASDEVDGQSFGEVFDYD